MQKLVKPKLSSTQLFVLNTLLMGGSLILDERENELFFSDSDGNDFWIRHTTVKKLLDLNLIQTGARPTLDYERFVPTQKARELFPISMEEHQEIDLKEIENKGYSDNSKRI